MFGGISNNSYVGGSSGGGGPSQNPNTQQNQPAVTLPARSQRVVSADLLSITTRSTRSNPSPRPAVGIGPGVAFFTRNVAGQVRATGQWQQIQGGNTTTNSVPAQVVISLHNGSAFLQLGNGHPHLYPLNTTEFQTRYGQSLQNFVAQYIPSPMGTLTPDIVHELGPYLSSNDLDSLSQVNRHLGNSTAPRRQAITNGMLLARGGATVLRSGHVVRQNPPVMNPAQFDNALRYIQNLPPNHQREPLQELVRHATTQAQFGAVFDHLRNQGRWPHIPLPANFAALSPAAQRDVEIFSWRLSAGSPREAISPLRHHQLLQVYAYAREIIERGEAFPHAVLVNHHACVGPLLEVFGGPRNLDYDAGQNWLIQESVQGNLRLTPDIYERLPDYLQKVVLGRLPDIGTNHDSKRAITQAYNYVSGRLPLNPPTIG